MEYNVAIEVRDYSKIDKLNALTDINTFWSDVCKLTKRVSSDHAIRRWQALAENRYSELSRRCIGDGDMTPLLQLFDRTMTNCLFYESEGKTNLLLNEIGVLRGISYALEEMGYYFHETHKDFARLIGVQMNMTKDERIR